MKEDEKLVVDSLLALKKDPDLRTYSDWSALSKLHKKMSKELKEHFYKNKKASQVKEEKVPQTPPKEENIKNNAEVLEFSDEEKFNRAMRKSPSLRTADDWALINQFME